MIHEITEKTVNFIAQWEGWKGTAYWDATGKVWTIGYGHTWGVSRGMTCTRTKALEWLKQDANRVAKFVNAMDMKITQEQFDALVCFGFNVGTGNLKKSTLLKLVKHSAPVENVMKEFYKWNKSRGQVQAGLVLRREGEAMLYGKGKYASKEDAQVHIEKRLGKHWRDAVGCK